MSSTLPDLSPSTSAHFGISQSTSTHSGISPSSSSPDFSPSLPTRLPAGPGPVERTLRRCVGELLDPATLSAARVVADRVAALPAAHHALALACIAAAVHNQLPFRTATQLWAPRRRDPLAVILDALVEHVARLEPAAVEVAVVLLDDGFEGSFEQLFVAAASLARQ